MEQWKATKAWSVFVLVFFASGAAGLAWQVVWSKAFAATIGHEYPAMLAVVTAFMAGMALGNACLARRKKLHPRLYGWLEIVIGAWGLLTVLLVPVVESWVVRALGTNPAPILHWTVVFVAVLLALFPATAAMGATFPAAERLLSSTMNRHTTGLLYAANTAGAMLGALAAAFWLMPMLGIRGALIIFALVNLACGGIALRLVRGITLPERKTDCAERFDMKWTTRLFICGLLGIGFEVVVIRALAHVLENTVFTFAVVLAVYLGGTALGALAFHRMQRIKSAPVEVLFGLLAFACVVTALTLRWAPQLYLQLRDALGDSLWAVATAESLTAAAFFIVPAFLMGAVWSSLVQSTLAFRRSLAWAVAINTTGAALAPMIFGLGAIPLAGLKGALAIIPLGYALLGGRRKLTLIAAIAAVAVVPAITSVREFTDTNGARILSLQEGVMGSVAVLENESGARTLKFNNRFQMGGTAARIAEERQAVIPLLLHPSPKRALFIGLGTGITFGGAAHFPGLIADGVELVPEIESAIPFFAAWTNSTAQLRTHVADGRRFVRAVDQHYDVVVSDLFHPAQDGAGFLYTQEHFTAIREKLAAGGLFCQWLPVYQMDRETVRIIMATFSSVFPEGDIWLLRFSIDLPVIGLVGRDSPRRYPEDPVEHIENTELREELRRLGLNDSLRLFGCFVGSIPEFPLSPINRDMDPLLIFGAPEITFRRKDDPAHRLMQLIAEFRQSPALLFEARNSFSDRYAPQGPSGSNDFVTRLAAFIQARDVYLGGLQREASGDLAAAIVAFVQSAKTSHDFTAGYAQALGIATSLARENPDQSKQILKALVEAQPDRPVARELLERLGD